MGHRLRWFWIGVSVGVRLVVFLRDVSWSVAGGGDLDSGVSDFGSIGSVVRRLRSMNGEDLLRFVGRLVSVVGLAIPQVGGGRTISAALVSTCLVVVVVKFIQ